MNAKCNQVAPREISHSFLTVAAEGRFIIVPIANGKEALVNIRVASIEDPNVSVNFVISVKGPISR